MLWPTTLKVQVRTKVSMGHLPDLTQDHNQDRPCQQYAQFVVCHCLMSMFLAASKDFAWKIFQQLLCSIHFTPVQIFHQNRSSKEYNKPTQSYALFGLDFMEMIPSSPLGFLRGVFLANHLASNDNLTRTIKRQNTYQLKLTIHKNGP